MFNDTKTNKKFYFTLITMIIMCLVFVGSASAFAGGDGTQSNPYQIATPEHMLEVKDYLNAYFVITANLDMSQVTWTPIPAGFMGNFNGNYYTISNLSDTMFTDLQSGAKIDGIIIKNANINYTGTGIRAIFANELHNGAECIGVNIYDSSIKAPNGKASAIIGKVISDSSMSTIPISYNHVHTTTIEGGLGASAIYIEENTDVVVTISDSSITDCTIISDSGFVGGAVSSTQGSLMISTTPINNCIIINNGNNINSDTAGGYVGYSEDFYRTFVSTSSIKNSYIEGPSAGGIFSIKCQNLGANEMKVSYCTIKATDSNGYAGGICPDNGTNEFSLQSTLVEHCSIIGDTACGLFYSSASSGTVTDIGVEYCNVYGTDINDVSNCPLFMSITAVDPSNIDKAIVVDTTGTTSSFDEDNNVLTVDVKSNGNTGIRGASVMQNTTGTKKSIEFVFTNTGNTYTDYPSVNANGKYDINWFSYQKGDYTLTMKFENPAETISGITAQVSARDPFSIKNFQLTSSTGSLGQFVSGLAWVNGGYQPYTYEWLSSNDNGTTWSPITNHGTDDYPKFKFDAEGTYLLRFKVTDSSSPSITLDSLVSYPDVSVTINAYVSINYAKIYPNRLLNGDSMNLQASVNNPLNHVISCTWYDSAMNVVATTSSTTMDTPVVLNIPSWEEYYTFVLKDETTSYSPDTVMVTVSKSQFYNPLTIDKTTVPVGTSTNVTLNVNAETHTAEYQKSLDKINWTNMSSNVDTINDTTPTTHYYRAIIDEYSETYSTNTVSCTSTSSSSLTITNVNITPTTGSPTDKFTMSATATGGVAPLTYTWYASTNPSSWGTSIGTGATLSNYEFGATGEYYINCVVSDSDTPVTSKSSYSDFGFTNVKATITSGAPVISSVSISPTQGPLTKELSLNATVTGATSYSWGMKKPSESTFTTIGTPSTPSMTYTFNEMVAGTYEFKLTATNVSGSTDSNVVTYEAHSPPSISSVSVSPTSGNVVNVLSLSATVTDATSMYWEMENPNGDITRLSGTTPTYVYNFNQSIAGIYKFRLIASNDYGTTTSTDAIYTASILPVPIINNISITPTSSKEPTTITLYAEVDGQGETPTYQWQIKPLGASSYTDISGATTATYNYNMTYTEKGKYYFRLVTQNSHGSTISTDLPFTIRSNSIWSDVEESTTKNMSASFIIAILSVLCLAGIFVLVAVKTGHADIKSLFTIASVTIVVIILVIIAGTIDSGVIEGFSRLP